ncbi:tetratricopeptide repeat protein [Streptomyces sp. 372A]
MGAGHDVSHNAIGDNSQVVDNRQYFFPAPAKEVSWPVEIGAIPALATAFQPRTELRELIDTARMAGDSAVLTQVLSGGGGVGKSQLAAKYATEALRDGTDLVLWATAAETEQVITRYAQAALLVSAPGASSEDPENDAQAFLSWLATTDRRWLVVLDDITDPAAMAPWWPASRTGTGWVLASTRLHDAALTGNGRRRVPIDVYTPDEAAAYLRSRLTNDGAAHLLSENVADLATALGHLPLALGHAAAYMLNQDITVTEYLDLFNNHDRCLEHLLPEGADAEGYGRQVAATLLLSLDAAQRTEPAGLARPALRLAALLGPAGHPHDLWNTPTALTYLSQQSEPSDSSTAAGEARGPVSTEQADAVLRILHRYALISSDRSQHPHTIRIHALTARAVREATPKKTLPHLAHAAADALLDIWPSIDQTTPDLATALRANAEHLQQHTDDHLWQKGGRRLLFRVCVSLHGAGLTAGAVAYAEQLAATSERVLGRDHLCTIRARHNLANAYRCAGRTIEATTIQEGVLADFEQLLEPDHLDTIRARGNLAASYADAGRTAEAIALREDVLANFDRLLGPNHPDPISARHNLASSYKETGRIAEATALLKGVLADRERLLGPNHPDTIRARGNLAAFYEETGRPAEAAVLREAVLSDFERLLGPNHPDTLTARSSLAASHAYAGRITEATALQVGVLADRERLQGPDHPDTIDARNNLANCYAAVGRADEAAVLRERVLADRERLQGSDHPDTAVARGNLAVSYADAGRTAEAIALRESVLASSERLRGSAHPDTLRARHNLAGSYKDAGRITEATTLQESVLADRERLQGHDHPDTLSARNNLAVFYAAVRHITETAPLQGDVPRDH